MFHLQGQHWMPFWNFCVHWWKRTFPCSLPVNSSECSWDKRKPTKKWTRVEATSRAIIVLPNAFPSSALELEILEKLWKWQQHLSRIWPTAPSPTCQIPKLSLLCSQLEKLDVMCKFPPTFLFFLYISFLNSFINLVQGLVTSWRFTNYHFAIVFSSFRGSEDGSSLFSWLYCCGELGSFSPCPSPGNEGSTQEAVSPPSRFERGKWNISRNYLLKFFSVVAECEFGRIRS